MEVSYQRKFAGSLRDDGEWNVQKWDGVTMTGNEKLECDHGHGCARRGGGHDP